MAVEVLGQYLDNMAEVRLVPGHKGIFELWLGRPGEEGAAKLYDKKETGRFPTPGEALRALRPLIDA